MLINIYRARITYVQELLLKMIHDSDDLDVLDSDLGKPPSDSLTPSQLDSLLIIQTLLLFDDAVPEGYDDFGSWLRSHWANIRPLIAQEPRPSGFSLASEIDFQCEFPMA